MQGQCGCVFYVCGVSIARYRTYPHKVTRTLNFSFRNEEQLASASKVLLHAASN